MARIALIEVPGDSLLMARWRPGDFADCYVAEVPGSVSLARYLTAFFSSPAFWLERNGLHLIGRGANARDIAALAEGRTKAFAAWDIEERDADQILMRDFTGKTRCWLRVQALPNKDATRLHFGSWVNAKGESGKLSLITHAAYPFHRAYSRILLAGAVRNLRNQGKP